MSKNHGWGFRGGKPFSPERGQTRKRGQACWRVISGMIFRGGDLLQKCRRQGFASLSKRRRQDSTKINSEELELGIEMRHAQKPCACTTGPIKGSDDNQEFLPGLREARGCDAAKSAKTRTTGNSRENIFAYVSTAQPAGMARPLASAQIATSEFMQLWIEKMLDAGLPFRPKKLRPAQRQSGPPVQTSIAFSAF